MTVPCAKTESRIRWVAAAVCAVAGLALFQFFGNATRGYVPTTSMFWWCASQWLGAGDDAEQAWLILAIGGWLFWRNLRRDAAAESAEAPEGAALVGGAAMVGALALHALGFVAQQTRLSAVALLVFLWGVLVLADRRWARAAAFPLGFLVFAIPLSVLDSLGFWLRMGVLDAAEGLARIGGFALVRNGTQLLSPDGRYHYDVAAACSGVRSLMALAALSLLIGYLHFRTTWRRVLLLALCLPLTYVGNVVRIGVIVLAAQAGGQVWGERAHVVMGIGVFVIVLGGAVGAAGLLARWWPEPAMQAKRSGEGRSVSPAGPRGAAIAAVVVVALAIGEMGWLGRLAAAPGRGAAGVRLSVEGAGPVELPVFIGSDWIGRQVEVTAVEREILPPDTGFSRRSYVNVADGRHAVFVSVVLSGRDRTSIHRPELCLVGQGWTIVGEEPGRFAAGGGSVSATLLRIERTVERGGAKVPALVAYWFVNSEGVVASHWARFWRDAWARVRQGRADRWAYVLVQTDALGGEAAAQRRIQTVLDGVLPGLLTVTPK